MVNLSIENQTRLTDLAEQFLCSAPAQRSTMFTEMMAELREALTAGRYDEVAMVLRRVASPMLDYTATQSLYRVRKQLRGKTTLPSSPVKLAVLGSFTTKQLVAFIDLYLFATGVEAEIYEGEYGVFRQEIFDRQSQLYSFGPKIVLLATGWRDLSHRPALSNDSAQVNQIVETEQADWTGLWQRLHAELGCQVIQNNFVIPAWRSFSNHEMRQPGSLGRYVASVNRSLVETAPAFVTIHDVDHLAASAGRWNWDDPRFAHQAKIPCAPEYLVDYAHNIASIVGVQLGVVRKCLVLDLDNTLWGGVIGDDGLGGIRLGQGSPEGEAFLAFQDYIKTLRLRGVILAVCSKNQEKIAREVFEKHPEMVLRLDDISCFVANWNDKATNLRMIAKELNIGLSSLVFIDDNPAERAIVRQLVPEVAVPELPEDVTGYVQVIDRHRYFQALSVGAEDFQRTEYYRADSLRRVAQTSTSDMESYLKSLEMAARIAPIDVVSLERSVQLIQRSNQFNLTTRRHSAAELSAMLVDPSWITRTVSLADRFGDNGLISVLLAQVNGDILEIDTWLMSCRVLKRGVEPCLLNHLCSLARERGITSIRGQFIPTAKNELVRDHYAGLGFTRVAGGADSPTTWELVLTSDWKPLPHFIKEIN